MSDKVCELAAEAKLNDADMLELYSKVREALAAIGSVDSGIGGGWCDFWIQHNGIEYKLVMKPHRVLKDGSCPTTH